MTEKYTLTGEKPIVTGKDRERFASKVDMDTCPDGCHEWTGSFGNAKDPRGKFQAQGIQDAAYRWAVVLGGAWLEEGDVVNHLCNNSKCVRVEHLEITDLRGNSEHMVASDRHGSAKLTAENIRAIRSALASPDRPPLRALARAYGVSASTVSNVANNRSWRSVRKK